MCHFIFTEVSNTDIIVQHFDYAVIILSNFRSQSEKCEIVEEKLETLKLT